MYSDEFKNTSILGWDAKLILKENEHGIELIDKSEYDGYQLYDHIFIDKSKIPDFFKMVDDYKEFLKILEKKENNI